MEKLQTDALSFFFFNDTATTEIYTLPLHDALPISAANTPPRSMSATSSTGARAALATRMFTISPARRLRSEEHTSELQSRLHLVCRLLLEKKNKERGNQPVHNSHLTQAHTFIEHLP